ncbi:MAG: hypothetical protein AAF367_20450 [Pseudomonadota bacterium]
MFEFVTDLVRLIHMLCFAVGIGCAVFLESVVLGRARIRVDLEELALIERGHRLIFRALVGLWISGLILIAIRTNLDPAAITPKLFAKLAVVTVLTLNAAMIAWFVNPLMNSIAFGQLSDLGRRDLCTVGAAAGLSGAGWISALMLGAITALKTMLGHQLALLFGVFLLGGALAGALISAILVKPEVPQEPAIRRMRTNHHNPPRAHGGDTIDRVLKETIYAQPIHRPFVWLLHRLSGGHTDDGTDRKVRREPA